MGYSWRERVKTSGDFELDLVFAGLDFVLQTPPLGFPLHRSMVKKFLKFREILISEGKIIKWLSLLTHPEVFLPTLGDHYWGYRNFKSTTSFALRWLTVYCNWIFRQVHTHLLVFRVVHRSCRVQNCLLCIVKHFTDILQRSGRALKEKKTHHKWMDRLLQFLQVSFNYILNVASIF